MFHFMRRRPRALASKLALSVIALSTALATPVLAAGKTITAVMVLPAANTGEAIAVDSATTDSASVEANARRPRRIKLNIKVSPDVKLFKGRLLIEHEGRSLGELTSCNAFIFRDLQTVLGASIRFRCSPWHRTHGLHKVRFGSTTLHSSCPAPMQCAFHLSKLERH